jgi:phosphomannomutase
MKFALRGAIPVGEKTGLSDIRDLAMKGEYIASEKIGTIETHNIKDDYIDYFTSFADFQGKKFTIAVDTANAMGVLELDMYRKFPGELTMVNIYDDLSHPFECHEANPLKQETLAELQMKVKEVDADLGICYDGDADRVGFVEETMHVRDPGPRLHRQGKVGRVVADHRREARQVQQGPRTSPASRFL